MKTMKTIAAKTQIKLADEVWIATALLHREHPDRPDFTVQEIIRARQEKLGGPTRAGFYVTAMQHCVANRPPNPGRYRMLFETSAGRRRLFRKGDPYHPEREGAKIVPHQSDLPYGYSGLIAWYRDWSSAVLSHSQEADPLLALVGSGKRLWAREHADDYVRRLRQGWQ